MAPLDQHHRTRPGGSRSHPTFRLATCLAVLAGAVGVAAASTAATPVVAGAAAPVLSGMATNFDVANGTDKECEGFEVEIEDITTTAVTYTWPGSSAYVNPYGSAQPSDIVGTTFPDGHSGVRVTFHATYAGHAWSASTAVGAINHFGVHVTGTPGVQRYSWLCDLGGVSAGSTGVLTPYGGTTTGNYYVYPSAPSIVPTVVATPAGEGVQTQVIPAEVPSPAEARLPDAVWVVKYRARSASAVDVNNLVVTDPEVQAAVASSNIASVAELFQPDPATNVGAETEAPDVVQPGDRSEITVTETYQYTGPVDPADNSTTCTDVVGDPNNCSNFVGTLIARQMASAQLGTVTPRAPFTVAVTTDGRASGAGGNITSGPLPGGADPSSVDCGSDGGPCFSNVDDPTTVVLSAAPNPGYVFRGWTGACSGSSATCTIPVTGPKAVTAAFGLLPTVTGSSPAAVRPGQSVAKFIVSGTGFHAGATVGVSGTGVSVTVTKVTKTAVTGTLTVAAGAGLGTRDLTVRNANGDVGTCTGCLAVYEPTITSVSPTAVPRGAKKMVVVVTGSGFAAKAAVTVAGGGVKVKATLVDASHLNLLVTVAATATPGLRSITVTNKDGATATATGMLSIS